MRDWQTDNPTSAALAKSYPSHGPLGPWLVTADEFNPHDSELRTYLNAELRQRGRFLQPGDSVRIEIDGLGHLDNPVRAYRATARRNCAAGQRGWISLT